VERPALDDFLGLMPPAKETPIVTKEVLRQFAVLKGVRKLNIEGVFFDASANLSVLGDLDELERIEIVWTNVTDSHIGQLSGCKRLRYLTIHDGMVSDQVMPLLTEIPALEGVVFQGNRFFPRRPSIPKELTEKGVKVSVY
jgi:hypothetical protein